MSRFPVLLNHVIGELMLAAAAMADGSYWADPKPWEREAEYHGSEPEIDSSSTGMD